MEETEKLMRAAANAKLVHLNEQLLYPMLQTKVEERLASLCNELKASGTVKLADVAYIAACRDLLADLEAKARYGDKAAQKLNYHPDITTQQGD